ncbi:unnamed protein product [Acanthoscelides obtectus]|uniref:Transposase Helix-turn-helix domain-containing protein n=1 Tax=Acanthoscelides obtectus TaxID=200917 RepID=A0A9P0JZD9_ACAOB|nr:unnamed protein product [Acanthoscelides obtectus]CAK1631437.1 hypothetical protein AOBTE_LOCUS6956 [Acanthoscelides obtectus]
MSYTDFELLLNKVGHMIGKTDTQMRTAIPVKERFCVALRFFASGDSFVSLSYLFKFSPQIVFQCVFDVCDALISVLNDQIKDLSLPLSNVQRVPAVTIYHNLLCDQVLGYHGCQHLVQIPKQKSSQLHLGLNRIADRNI